MNQPFLKSSVRIAASRYFWSGTVMARMWRETGRLSLWKSDYHGPWKIRHHWVVLKNTSSRFFGFMSLFPISTAQDTQTGHNKCNTRVLSWDIITASVHAQCENSTKLQEPVEMLNLLTWNIQSLSLSKSTGWLTQLRPCLFSRLPC